MWYAVPQVEKTRAELGGASFAKTTADRKSPWRIGWESVKVNAVPMVVLWALAAVMVLAYYFFPGVAEALDPVARWQTESGAVAAFLNRLVFNGVLPGIFLVAGVSVRTRRPVLTAVAQGVWCGLWGIVIDRFYLLQAFWFGTGHDLTTLAFKVAVDQFAFSAFLNAPSNAVFYFWAGRDFSIVRARREWPADFLRTEYLPILITNWVVCVPVLFAIYALPTPLQVQISGVTSAFWVLVCLGIGARRASCEPSSCGV